MTAPGPLIIHRDGRCWIRRGDSQSYYPSLAQRDVATRLTNLGVSSPLPRRGLSIDTSATLELHGYVAVNLERDFAVSGITWDPATETLTEGYDLPAIEPRHDAEVETWLRALAGGALADLYDWIAGCRQDRLSQPGAALALVGDPDVGKSLFASALARLWGCARATPLKATVAQFDGAKTECPIWFDDECEAIKAGLISSAGFRDLLQLREHFFERKNQEKRRLRGCARVVLACNELSDIRFADVTGPSAVQAIVDRLAMFVVPREHTEEVRAALARLRPPGQQDVDVDRIARHFAGAQLELDPRKQRFLGGRRDSVEARRAAYAGVVASAPALFEIVRTYLEGEPVTQRGLGVPALMHDGATLLALPSALAGGEPLAAVQRALEPFRRGSRAAKKVGGQTHRYWPLDAKALRVALGI